MLSRFLIALFAAVVAQLLPSTQHTALMEVFEALGCPNSTLCPRFPATSACPTSSSVTCSAGGVTIINLFNELAPLSGGRPSSISSSIGRLTNLKFLFLGNYPNDDNKKQTYGKGRLTGTVPIPSTLALCSGLEQLSMENNSLGGDLTFLSSLTRLQKAFLYSNQFTGTLPNLQMLTALRRLM
jgi:hypothetical protein